MQISPAEPASVGDRGIGHEPGVQLRQRRVGHEEHRELGLRRRRGGGARQLREMPFEHAQGAGDGGRPPAQAGVGAAQRQGPGAAQSPAAGSAGFSAS
jgi:hypothetical protein